MRASRLHFVVAGCIVITAPSLVMTACSNGVGSDSESADERESALVGDGGIGADAMPPPPDGGTPGDGGGGTDAMPPPPDGGTPGDGGGGTDAMPPPDGGTPDSGGQDSGPTCGADAGDAGSVEAGCAAGADAGDGNIDEGAGDGNGVSALQSCATGSASQKTSAFTAQQKPATPDVDIAAGTTGSCSFTTATWGIIMFPDVVCGAKCKDLNGVTFDPPGGAIAGACTSSTNAANACLLDETKKCSDRGGAFMITSGPTKCYGTGWVNGANLAIIGRKCNGAVDVDSTWSCTK